MQNLYKPCGKLWRIWASRVKKEFDDAMLPKGWNCQKICEKGSLSVVLYPVYLGQRGPSTGLCRIAGCWRLWRFTIHFSGFSNIHEGWVWFLYPEPHISKCQGSFLLLPCRDNHLNNEKTSLKPFILRSLPRTFYCFQQLFTHAVGVDNELR